MNGSSYITFPSNGSNRLRGHMITVIKDVRSSIHEEIRSDQIRSDQIHLFTKLKLYNILPYTVNSKSLQLQRIVHDEPYFHGTNIGRSIQ